MESCSTTQSMTVPELTAAVIRREFMPVYEPAINLESGSVVGWQAQGRWLRRSGEMSTDVDYAVPAGAAGLLGFVESMVVERALRRFRRWSGGLLPAEGPWLAIRVSASRLASPSVVDWMARVAEHYAVPVGRLVVDTGGFAGYDDSDDMVAALARVRAMGAAVAMTWGFPGDADIDPKRYPVDVLRLDGHVVRSLTGDDAADSRVKALVERAHNAGVAVIAEGVERDEQRAALASFGPCGAQGSLFGGPAADLELPTGPGFDR